MHRQIIDSAIFADPNLLRLWVWLLSRTSFKASHVTMSRGRGSTVVTLNPGECIIGRHAAAAELGWKPSTFRDRLARLKDMGMIEIKPDNQWSVVFIVNWGLYQVNDEDNPTSNRHQTDNKTRQQNPTTKPDNKPTSKRIGK
jgi:hypothetical protein